MRAAKLFWYGSAYKAVVRCDLTNSWDGLGPAFRRSAPLAHTRPCRSASTARAWPEIVLPRASSASREQLTCAVRKDALI